MGLKFLNFELQIFVSWTANKLINAWAINRHLHFPDQHYSFQGFFQTFPYLWSFSRLFKALKISTLNSRTFHTFPGSVRTPNQWIVDDCACVCACAESERCKTSTSAAAVTSLSSFEQSLIHTLAMNSTVYAHSAHQIASCRSTVPIKITHFALTVLGSLSCLQ